VWNLTNRTAQLDAALTKLLDAACCLCLAHQNVNGATPADWAYLRAACDRARTVLAGRAASVSDIPASVVDKASWVDLKELDEHGENLTQWEIDYVESLHGWLRAGRTLTDKQRATLDRIRGDRL
jgi:hypothetical protein